MPPLDKLVRIGPALYDRVFKLTNRQRDLLDAFYQLGSVRGAARAVGGNASQLSRLRKTPEAQRYLLNKEGRSSEHIQGFSTQRIAEADEFGLNPNQRSALEALSDSPSLREAARRSDMDPGYYHRLMNSPKGKAFFNK